MRTATVILCFATGLCSSLWGMDSATHTILIRVVPVNRMGVSESGLVVLHGCTGSSAKKVTVSDTARKNAQTFPRASSFDFSSGIGTIQEAVRMIEETASSASGTERANPSRIITPSEGASFSGRERPSIVLTLTDD